MRKAGGFWVMGAVVVGAVVFASLRRPDTSWMPLSPGTRLTYEVAAGLDADVIDAQIVSGAAVGSVAGFSLQGPRGESRLAWSGDRLLASKLGGFRADPPVPLFAPLAKEESLRWDGQLRTLQGDVEAEGQLTSEETKERVDGVMRNARLTVLSIRSTLGEDELKSWFVPRVGLVRQEHRRNGLLLNRLVLMDTRRSATQNASASNQP